MEAEDLIIGNKYFPHSKMGGSDMLENSIVWNGRGGSKQGFLYYTGYENGRYHFDAEYEGECSGDFFYPCDFTPYEEFTLPEKWCVKLVDQEIADYVTKNGEMPPYFVDPKIRAHFPPFDGFACTTGRNIQDGYTEITPEQFKTHVLNSKVMNKKLIGYNLKPEFESMKDAASYIAFNSPGWTINTLQFRIGNRDMEIDRLRGAGVLDLWFDEVYEDENKEETHHLGDKAVTVTFRKEGIFADGKKFDIKPFKGLIHITDINGYSLTINEFKIGCTTVRRGEVEDLIIKADRFYGR
jgi:hypothetical protein